MEPTTERALIVTADDFGLSPGVNRGVIRAHEEGIVTSASLMVRWPAAGEAAAYARRRPSLAVGLHLDLGEWAYRDGQWVVRYEVVAGDDAAAVAAEVADQVERFRQLTGRDPTHVDGHQHVHRSEPAGSVVAEVAGALGVPVREQTRGVRYSGEFHGQSGRGEPWPEGITVEALLAVISRLPPGVTELGCHPAEHDDSGAVYGPERTQELRALCDARVREAIAAQGVRLLSFHDVALGSPGHGPAHRTSTEDRA